MHDSVQRVAEHVREGGKGRDSGEKQRLVGGQVCHGLTATRARRSSQGRQWLYKSLEASLVKSF